MGVGRSVIIVSEEFKNDEDIQRLNDFLLRLTDTEAQSLKEKKVNEQSLIYLLKRPRVANRLTDIHVYASCIQAQIRAIEAFSMGKIVNQAKALKKEVTPEQAAKKQELLAQYRYVLINYLVRVQEKLDNPGAVIDLENTQPLVNRKEEKGKVPADQKKEEAVKAPVPSDLNTIIAEAKSQKQKDDEKNKRAIADMKRVSREQSRIPPAPAVDPDLAKKIAAFEKIYRAIYAGETSVFKDRSFLEGREHFSAEELRAAIIKSQKSRTHTAWILAEKHFNHCTMDNADLFAEAHRYAYRNSSYFFGIFSQSTVKTLDTTDRKGAHKVELVTALNEVKDHILKNPNSRSAKMRNEGFDYQPSARRPK